MGKIETAIRLWKKDKKKLRQSIARNIGISKLSRLLPDKVYLSIQTRGFLGYSLSLKNPKTFNEKLQWLKLYDRNPQYISMVDKYAAKEYAANLIGVEYIVPTYCVWERIEDVDFESLPSKFVLKCTHDSGSIIVCNDKSKLNREEALNILRKGLSRNMFFWGREWPYKKVKPQIIAESYLQDENGRELFDYKFFCFNGRAMFYKIDFDRFTNHKANYYDLEGRLLPFGEEVCPPDPNRVFSKPKDIKRMIELAEILSNNIPFLRVDFYYPNEKIYLGEMTFYPATGFGPFLPEEWDMKLGKMLELNTDK